MPCSAYAIPGELAAALLFCMSPVEHHYRKPTRLLQTLREI
jgi:hypothetical protein